MALSGYFASVQNLAAHGALAHFFTLFGAGGSLGFFPIASNVILGGGDNNNVLGFAADQALQTLTAGDAIMGFFLQLAPLVASSRSFHNRLHIAADLALFSDGALFGAGGSNGDELILMIKRLALPGLDLLRAANLAVISAEAFLGAGGLGHGVGFARSMIKRFAFFKVAQQNLAVLAPVTNYPLLGAGRRRNFDTVILYVIRLGIYNSVIRPDLADRATHAAMAFLSAGSRFIIMCPIVLAVIAFDLIQVLLAGIAILGSLPALRLAVAGIRPITGSLSSMVVGVDLDIALFRPIALGAAPQLLALFRAGRFLGYANENLGMLFQRQFFGIGFVALVALPNDSAVSRAGRGNSLDNLNKLMFMLRLISGRSAVRQTGDRDREQQRRNHEYAKKFLHV